MGYEREKGVRGGVWGMEMNCGGIPPISHPSYFVSLLFRISPISHPSYFASLLFRCNFFPRTNGDLLLDLPPGSNTLVPRSNTLIPQL